MGFRQTPRRTAQTWLHRQSQHHSERLAAIRYSHQSRTMPTRNFLADFPAPLSAPNAGLRFLHRRDDPPQNAVCALLHRVRDAPCLSGGLYCISQCLLGNPTSPPTHLAIEDQTPPIGYLIHDNDTKFNRSFDAVFQSERVEIIRTPFHAPNANAFAERWVRTVRTECLDHLLIWDERHLQRVLAEYLRYYNGRRPHQGLAQDTPDSLPSIEAEGRVIVVTFWVASSTTIIAMPPNLLPSIAIFEGYGLCVSSSARNPARMTE